MNAASSRTRGVASAIINGLFAVVMAGSAIGYLLHAAPFAQAIAHLGYPAYLLTILGVAKLAGVAALLQPRLPWLREWALAGFVIDLAGAAASHLFVGDGVDKWSAPLVLLGLVLVGRALRRDAQQPGPDPVHQEEQGIVRTGR
jgi:hypothetical protein